MKWLHLVHRWTGGFIGLILAVLGLSGAILIHKDSWIALPHAGDARIADPAVVAAATERLLSANPKAQGIVYASDRFGLHQLRLPKGAGAYADQAGDIVTRWSSQWQRPELWIFDLHHHLFSGDVGETVSGIAGLAAILFVVTGAILWWRTRQTFKFRLWPRRLSRPSIVMQHRDLGIVVAPLLLLSAVTGTMMIFRPVAMLIVAPFSPPAQVAASLAAPKLESGPLAPAPDWRGDDPRRSCPLSRCADPHPLDPAQGRRTDHDPDETRRRMAPPTAARPCGSTPPTATCSPPATR